MFNLFYYKHMDRCMFSPFERVKYSIAFYFLIICTILIGFPIQYLKIFLVHILSNTSCIKFYNYIQVLAFVIISFRGL